MYVYIYNFFDSSNQSTHETPRPFQFIEEKEKKTNTHTHKYKRAQRNGIQYLITSTMPVLWAFFYSLYYYTYNNCGIKKKIFLKDNIIASKDREQRTREQEAEEKEDEKEGEEEEEHRYI